eukprot:7412-Heterococcus_DN1.PRE.1
MFREKGSGRPNTSAAAGARGGAGATSHLAALLDSSSYLLGLDSFGSYGLPAGAGSAANSNSSSSGSEQQQQQLFTQRVAVLPPKGAKDLVVWKRMLAADTAAAAGEANARSIRAALREAGITSRCAWGLVRAAPTARESVYSAGDLEQLVSWAVSAQLQLDAETSSSADTTSSSSTGTIADASNDSSVATAADTTTAGATAADASVPSTVDTAATAVLSSTAAAGSSSDSVATASSVEPPAAVQAESSTTADATDTAAAPTDDKSATLTTTTATAAAAPAVTVQAGLAVSTQAVLTALSMVAEAKAEGQALEPKLRTLHLENDFERRVMSECVISPQDVGVTFDDVQVDKLCALLVVRICRSWCVGTVRCLYITNIGTASQLAVYLLSRTFAAECSHYHTATSLNCTGKTMLSKAIATESGAHFIHISMASIGSKWFSDSEKYVRAVFSVASKLSPAIIFLDECDSMLSSRNKQGEHEAMRKIKTEWMALWDGLRTASSDMTAHHTAPIATRLSACWRANVTHSAQQYDRTHLRGPYDLDEAVLRRFSRRLMSTTSACILPNTANALQYYSADALSWLALALLATAWYITEQCNHSAVAQHTACSLAQTHR